MKIKSIAVASAGILLVAGVLSLSSCQKGDLLGDLGDLFNKHDPTLHVDLQHAAVHIEDKNKMEPVGSKTKLWNNRGHLPIMTPDGHQITLGEFNMAAGRADIRCVNKGTQVSMNFHGLVPNEVYTIWVLTFKAPGFDGTMNNLIGMGALGPKDGSQNSFKADAYGNAMLPPAIQPKGNLSIFGSVGSCLSSEFEVHLVGAYHLDNMAHGGSPGDASTWVAQFVFQFKGGF